MKIDQIEKFGKGKIIFTYFFNIFVERLPQFFDFHRIFPSLLHFLLAECFVYLPISFSPVIGRIAFHLRSDWSNQTSNSATLNRTVADWQLEVHFVKIRNSIYILWIFKQKWFLIKMTSGDSNRSRSHKRHGGGGNGKNAQQPVKFHKNKKSKERKGRNDSSSRRSSSFFWKLTKWTLILAIGSTAYLAYSHPDKVQETVNEYLPPEVSGQNKRDLGIFD